MEHFYFIIVIIIIIIVIIVVVISWVGVSKEVKPENMLSVYLKTRNKAQILFWFHKQAKDFVVLVSASVNSESPGVNQMNHCAA